LVRPELAARPPAAGVVDEAERGQARTAQAGELAQGVVAVAAAGESRELAGRGLARTLSIHSGRRVGARGRRNRVAEGLEDDVLGVGGAARGRLARSNRLLSNQIAKNSFGTTPQPDAFPSYAWDFPRRDPHLTTGASGRAP
jgi:hypothetical protein